MVACTFSCDTPNLVTGLAEEQPGQHSDYHKWLEGDGFKAFEAHFDHPLYKRMETVA